MKQTIAIDDTAKIGAPPQTWTANVGVPLLQNVLGGVATSGIVAIVWRTVGDLPPIGGCPSRWPALPWRAWRR